jgi:hypothetical protein
MALAVLRPASEVAVVGQMADLATANSTAYVVATHRGRLVRAQTIIANAITTADATVSVKVSKVDGAGVMGSAVEVGTITIATSGSAAGDVDSTTFNATATANFVNEGDLISFVSDGASDTTTLTRCQAIIRRGSA